MINGGGRGRRGVIGDRRCHHRAASTVTLRPMTEAEFVGFRQATARYRAVTQQMRKDLGA